MCISHRECDYYISTRMSAGREFQETALDIRRCTCTVMGWAFVPWIVPLDRQGAGLPTAAKK